jgi:hypothetical protein
MWQSCLIVAAFIVLFIFVGWLIFGFTKTSLGISALLGVLVGWLLAWRVIDKYYSS